MLIESMVIEPCVIFIITNIRNNRTAEIKSFIPIIQYDFGRIAIEQSIKTVFFRKRLYQSCDLCSLRFKTLHNRLYLPSLYKWFVALYIDNDIFSFSYTGIGLETAIRTAFMIFRSHHDLSPERVNRIKNTPVIRSHINPIQHSLYLFIYSLNHIFAFHIGKRFSRKSGRSISCRNNSYKFHKSYFYFSLLSIVTTYNCAFSTFTTRTGVPRSINLLYKETAS